MWRPSSIPIVVSFAGVQGAGYVFPSPQFVLLVSVRRHHQCVSLGAQENERRLRRWIHPALL